MISVVYKQFQKIGAAALGLAFCLSSASSFELIPFTATLEPSTKRVQDYTVKTDSVDPVAVELSVHSRDMDEKGNDILKEDEDHFLIFPSQFIVTRNSPQTIRVQWLGSDKGEEDLEKAYRLIAEQVPVDVESRGPKKGANIRILLKYVSSLYVTPANSSSKLDVLSIAPSPKDKSKLVLKVKNTGTRHIIVPDDSSLKMTVVSKSSAQGADKTIELGKADLAKFAGENILAGATRVFELAWPAALTDRALQSASVTYKEPQSY